MKFRERVPDANIVHIYVASFALGLAYGIAISLVAILLDARGFGKEAIGTLAAWFAFGIVLFAVPVGAIIRRFSAKSTLVCALIGYAATVAIFPFLDTYRAIAALRFVDGACSVGVWVSCETILLARSDARHKAFVTSIYAVTLAFGYVIGPLVARALSSLAPVELAFMVAGAIALAAGLYVLARLERDVPLFAKAANLAAPRVRKGPGPFSILWRIKTSCFATFAYGYFQASVVLFLPLFLIESKGITREQTIVIPAFFAAGMLLFSNYAGRLGDRFGHLITMRGLALIGMSMILGFVLLDSYAAMCGAVFVAGASLASISPVSLALQGVVTEARDFSRATAIYNAFYAAGMLLGPPLSSRIFDTIGGANMLYHLAALWAAFIMFTLAFQRDDPAVVRARKFIAPGAIDERDANECR